MRTGATGREKKRVKKLEAEIDAKAKATVKAHRELEITLRKIGETDAETTALLSRLATLTPQQVRVLMMLSEGLLNKQIAYELSVSEATVKAHVSAILQKLGVESRTQAVIAASKIEVGQWPQAAAIEH